MSIRSFFLFANLANLVLTIFTNLDMFSYLKDKKRFHRN